MIEQIRFKMVGPEISLLHQFIAINIQLKSLTICCALLLFFLASINELAFSNNFAEAYLLEVTGKIIIEAPKCGPNEVFDPGKDKCVGTPGPGDGPGGPGGPSPKPPLGPIDNGPGFMSSRGPPRPIILTPNASDVETEEGGKLIPFQEIVIVNIPRVRTSNH